LALVAELTDRQDITGGSHAAQKPITFYQRHRDTLPSGAYSGKDPRGTSSGDKHIIRAGKGDPLFNFTVFHTQPSPSLL
jgi:hypothetical protein